MGKKLLKVLGIVLLVIVVAAGGFVVFLTATEYKPAAVEYIDAPTLGEPETPGGSVRIVTWNVGYCGLGAEEDFVMDGGSGDAPVVTRTVYPTYRGALVVCQGGDRADVKLAVTEAVAALTGLSADRITVAKSQ